uniref:(California timema) hypothetical protein n=1 Tax=Timema californicum TaxID=61474 RepID=A0A7R9J529_TIMCA|nr:unnamed protein product [Timema californicum]
MFWIKLLMWMLPILASCLGGAGAKLYRRESDDPETWTGRWLPERYPSPAISHPDLHDSKHGVQMGIPSVYCDDAKLASQVVMDKGREREELHSLEFGLVEIGEETALGLLILYTWWDSAPISPVCQSPCSRQAQEHGYQLYQETHHNTIHIAGRGKGPEMLDTEGQYDLELMVPAGKVSRMAFDELCPYD